MPADTTPPTLINLNFAPTLDLSSGDRMLNIGGMAGDNHSGVSSVKLQFWSVSDTYTSSRLTGFSAYYTVSSSSPGTTSFSFAYQVGEFVPRGVYTLDEVMIFDKAGNMQQLTAEQVLATCGPVQLVLHDGNPGAVALPSTGDDHIVGVESNNFLRGYAGNDTLQGSAGYNRLEGGEGNDVLVPGSIYDFMDGGAGVDTVTWANFATPLNLTVEPYSAGNWQSRYVENFVLTAYADTLTIRQEAMVSAGAGNDIVSGAETWWSLKGPLTLYGEAGNDSLTGGPVNDNLFGGADNDYLNGAEGSDVIDGGTGADVMNGGEGDDIFYVENVSDIATGCGGTDTVFTSVSFTLSTDTENLTVIGGASVTLKGNSWSNTITGNTGADRIYGGLGNDLLRGDAGKDAFVFDTMLNKSTNVDRIIDFRSSDDSIYLDNKYFTKLGSGSIAKPKKFTADMFVEGKKAKDAEDRIVYDKKIGALYYDPDGTGSKAQVKIATITNKAKLYYHDFYVI
jgi:Ca2+-binding RTX toxin-like protein